MDEQNIGRKEFTNTSTQKTVRLKPLVRQPVVGMEQKTETKVVAIVQTNPAVAPGGSAPLINKATPNTLRPGGAPAMKSPLLSSLNLKPKVAPAAVVSAKVVEDEKTQIVAKKVVVSSADAPTPSGSPTVHLPKDDEESVQTQAMPKPKISMSPASVFAPAVAAATPVTEAETPTQAVQTQAVISPVQADASDGVKTQSIKKIKLTGVSPVSTNTAATITFQKPSAPVAPAGAAAEEAHTVAVPKMADNDATVKIQRPVRKGPIIAPAASAQPKVEVQSEETNTQSVDTISSGAPKLSAAPTVKLNVGKAAPAEAPAAAPVRAPLKPLGLKSETPAPAVNEVVSEPAEAPKSKLGLKIDETPAPEVPPRVEQDLAKLKKSKAASGVKESNGLYFTFAVLTIILVAGACAMTAIQYLNTYRPEILKRTIQLPMLENVGK